MRQTQTNLLSNDEAAVAQSAVLPLPPDQRMRPDPISYPVDVDASATAAMLDSFGCDAAERMVALQDAMADKTAKIAVIGLGYVGLPRIHSFIDAGFSTIGFDCDSVKVRQLRSAKSYIGHLPSELIAQWLDAGRFRPTADMLLLGEPDVVLICVPTPLSESRDPDLSCIEVTSHALAASLRPGQLVILESTTYPGTTRDVVLPILRGSGLREGEDFFLAYSPEREDPGNQRYAPHDIPKVVAGIDPLSAHLAASLYRQVVADVVPVSTPEVAEACKLVENTYRAVNIALVNELKILLQRMDIDVWEVIEAAATKPFGFQAFQPGPGLGGHCIPIDPFYLGWLARKHGLSTRFVELAGEVNTRMPEYVVEAVTCALNNQGKAVRGSKVCILGVAYKKDVDDPRESPAFAVMDLLHQRGALLSYNDPHIPVLPRMRHRNVPPLQNTEIGADVLAAQDCVVIVTDHSAYDYEQIVRHAPLVVDSRNATKHVNWGRAKIIRA